MFIAKNFTPIGGQSIREAPTIFSYSNIKDTFKDLFEPGYFSNKYSLFRPGDIIHVRMKDEIGQIYIGAIENRNVVLDDRAIMARIVPAAAATTKKTEPATRKRTRKKAA